MTLQLLTNSLVVALGTTAAASLLGFAMAIWASSSNRSVRIGLVSLAIITFALPAFLQVNCWIELFGVAGRWPKVLPFPLYSSAGAIAIMTVLLWPIAFGVILATLNGLDPGYLEAEPALRGLRLIRCLLWPMLRRSLAAAAVLVFVLAVNNFTVPALLQLRVLPAQIWVQFETNLNTPAALLKSIPLIVACILSVSLWRKQTVRWSSIYRGGTNFLRVQLGAPMRIILGTLAALVLVASLAPPIWEICMRAQTWTQLPAAWSAGWPVVWQTAMLAAVSAGLSVLLSLVTWRFRAAALLWFFFLVPGILLGILIVTLFNRGWLEAFYRSLGIIVFAWVIRYFAIAWQMTGSAFRSLDPDIHASALLAGASPWQQFRFVQWPLVRFRLTIGWYLVFLLCLWDVESILLILPPGGETLAVRIFGLLHYGHNAQVNALCLILLFVALAPLALILLFRRRGFFAALLAAMMLCTSCKQAPETPLKSRLFSSVEVIGHRGAGAGEFNKPRSVAVDLKDNLYVVDMTGRVQK